MTRALPREGAGAPSRGSARAGVGLLRRIIHIYRAAISPLLGPRCRYIPSCSHYAEEAIELHGAGRGLLLAVRRLLRCHPFSRGGLDPVPRHPDPGAAGQVRMSEARPGRAAATLGRP